MRRILCLLCILCGACTHQKLDEKSVCLGDVLWEELQKEDLEYNLETVISTLRANAKGKRTPVSDPLTHLSKYIEEVYEKKAGAALEKAEQVLAALIKQEEYHSVENGQLFYRILKEGKGPPISLDATPLLHFSERDLDGDVLYDTHKSGPPLRIPLRETVLGFQKGVDGMRIGERREIYVHPNLAYKHLGKTKPHQLIIYDVTVVEY